MNKNEYLRKYYEDIKNKGADRARKNPGLFAYIKNIFLFLIAFTAAGIFLAAAFDIVIMPLALKSGSEFESPDLIGKTKEEAEYALLKTPFTIFEDSSDYNDNFPVNTVSFQYPAAGTIIKPGRRIRVIISDGPKPILMPNVVGMPRKDAELMIKPLGLKYNVESVHSNNYIKGIVASQFPEGEKKVPENLSVTIYVSDGLPENDIVMPNLLDLSLSAAQDTLSAYKFTKINIQKEEAPDVLPETVIDQHPEPGTPTHKKVEVDIVVSGTQ
jgi:eukaryotic-like serine/threonine-protein kinase